MSSQAKIHWLAPTIIAVSLSSAVLLAVGHHLYNARLDKTVVPTSHYDVAGHSISAQQFDVSVGTAFAFLVRMLLLTSMSTAYVQIFWYNVRQTSPHSTLKQLDWARDIASNVFAIVDFKTTIEHPLLLVLALIVWLVPVGTIFPPGTLSVVSSPQQRISRINVPTFDFTTYKYVDRIDYTSRDYDNYWYYTGPSLQLLQLTAKVVSTGDLRSLEVPAPQAHWTTTATLPSLHCSNVSPDTRDAIFTNVWNSNGGNSSPGAPVDRYVSWVPWDHVSAPTFSSSDLQRNANLPFLNGQPTSHLSVNAPAVLWMAVMSQMPDIYRSFESYKVSDNLGNTTYSDPPAEYKEDGEAAFNWRNVTACRMKSIQSLSQDYYCNSELVAVNASAAPFTPADIFRDATLLRCELRSTPYTIAVNVTSGRPVISLSRDSEKEESSFNTSFHFNGPVMPTDGQNSSITVSGRACDTRNTTLPCAFEANTIRTLAFQAIFDAFNQHIVGTAQTGRDVRAPPTEQPVHDVPSIVNTILASTSELNFLRQQSKPVSEVDYGSWPDIQTIARTSGDISLQAAASIDNSPPAFPKALGNALEELFQNLTLSILSSPYFRAEYNSALAQVPSSLTDVTIVLDVVTTYVYNVAVLWAAYGSSVLGAVIIVILGLVSLLKNGVSYSNKFSSVVRVARTADLSAEVSAADASGADPLPKHLERARLDLSGVLEHKGYHQAPKEHIEDTAYHGASDETVGAD